MLELFLANDCTFFVCVNKTVFVKVNADLACDRVIVQKENHVVFWGYA